MIGVGVVVGELVPSRNRRRWSWSFNSSPARKFRSNRAPLAYQPGRRKADEARDGVR